MILLRELLYIYLHVSKLKVVHSQCSVAMCFCVLGMLVFPLTPSLTLSLCPVLRVGGKKLCVEARHLTSSEIYLSRPVSGTFCHTLM